MENIGYYEAGQISKGISSKRKCQTQSQRTPSSSGGFLRTIETNAETFFFLSISSFIILLTSSNFIVMCLLHAMTNFILPFVVSQISEMC